LIHLLKQALRKHFLLLLVAALLYAVGLLCNLNNGKVNSLPTVAGKIQQQLQVNERAFLNLVAQPELVALLAADQQLPLKQQYARMPFGLLVYASTALQPPVLTYWNNNRFLANLHELQKPDGTYFVDYQNGSFVVKKHTCTLGGIRYVVVGILPVRWHYFIENNYLQSELEGVKGVDNYFELSTDTKAYPIKVANEQIVCFLKQKQSQINWPYDWFTIICMAASVFVLFVYLHKVALTIVAQQQFKVAFLLLLSLLLLLRTAAYVWDFPLDESRLSLFDPSVYASNFLHPSLGDLLINVILVFWLVGFYKVYAPARKLGHLVARYALGYAFGLVTVWVGVTLFITNIIKSLVQDGKVSFDVANFFSLNVFSLVSFIILSFLVLIFFCFSNILFKIIWQLRITVGWQLMLVVIVGFGVQVFNWQSGNVGTNWVVVGWLLLFLLLLNYRQADLYGPIIKSSFFIFWVMIFALSVSALVMYQNKVVELDLRKRMAERLIMQSDPNGENLLTMAVAGIDSAALSRNFEGFTNEVSNKYLKDSLISANFNGYLNRYETSIYTFDYAKRPLYNQDSIGFSVFYNIIQKQLRHSNASGLYSYHNSQNQMCYLYQSVLKNANDTLGYFYVYIQPKQYKSEALYPELFKQVQDFSTDLNARYAYAVYNQGQLITKVNDYPFPLNLTAGTLSGNDFVIKKADGFTELWYTDGSNRVVAIVRKNSFWLEAATLFAYLFGVFLVVIAVFNIGNHLLKKGLRTQSVASMFSFNIRSQIHATILFISVFSFLVIGVATISFFYDRFNRNNQERLSKTIQVVAAQLQAKTKDMRSATAVESQLSSSDLGMFSKLEKTITEISEAQNVDINLFSAKGMLLASTQPYIYNKQLLSQRMDASAYIQLRNANIIRYVQNERIGNLQYVSMYIPLFNDKAQVYAYLNIPYLNSQVELNQEISGFLATLINLNAFIFLLAGAIAFVLTNRIVDSFAVIGNKMNEVGLGKINEVIVWHRNDEIGVLVNEYNKMVQKLEASAQALAQSEREGAWREMARQVAHEIKNPLTPMKLSIQYLQRAVDTDAPNTKELTKRVSLTLVEQIDQLAKIAGDFSQFANIGNLQLELLDLNQVLQSVVLLHSQNDVLISWQQPDDAYLLQADKVQLTRLFTNLVKNAIEAPRNSNDPIHIHIQQRVHQQTITVQITDNGTGIPSDMLHKIFTPNFTTKSSGTGLGLAICKGIVEKINGSISFHSEANKGTTFTVQLPASTGSSEV